MRRSKLIIFVEFKLNKIFSSSNRAIEVWNMTQCLSAGLIVRLENVKHSSIVLTNSINDKMLSGKRSRTIKYFFTDDITRDAPN